MRTATRTRYFREDVTDPTELHTPEPDAVGTRAGTYVPFEVQSRNPSELYGTIVPTKTWAEADAQAKRFRKASPKAGVGDGAKEITVTFYDAADHGMVVIVY